MTVSVGPQGTLRPDELLSVLGYTPPQGDIHVHRIALHQSAWHHTIFPATPWTMAAPGLISRRARCAAVPIPRCGGWQATAARPECHRVNRIFMTKEIIVNAAEMESRVAILENGRLMELHIEREQKIVGNIYKGRVTKVLKGMDAAFVDIGIELNAFLSASDVVAQEDDEDELATAMGAAPFRRSPNSCMPTRRSSSQVVRAPMGTKGARITTRLSLPGRYMVLMLNSGTYVGVSRKIEDSKERQRLRAIAGKIRPENYSLIVRTEAEGKSEEELQQDLVFLLDMAGRIEEKAAHVSAPALVHGDMTLVLRLIRDAFTRDINRLVVDSPSAYENILELVGMLSPHLKNRVFLYDEELPIFHAYNIEPEIERTLRRKVWLPSGGSLIIDQAEALIAIDVNTGRFVGSVELAETVLTTNLQAAEEVARQLRLRDLGGIIVVDFIDMDNPRHRAQVMKAFEEALRRDRAKIKVHNISAARPGGDDAQTHRREPLRPAHRTLPVLQRHRARAECADHGAAHPARTGHHRRRASAHGSLPGDRPSARHRLHARLRG